ncbi:MAG: response regulator transcription factor [Eubacteriales bacterium]|nr:response regulator transcription factor [Eubacteriales bacterium]
MKVLIADDEPAVLEGLKYIIDWEDLGFTICSEASTGSEAFEKLLKLWPDLVLMDIKMPHMTGIEIIQKARKAGFTGHFIILSGYSDFTYAQTAIRYGVNFYLTKPIDEDELEEAVRSVADAIRKERKDSSNMHQYREKARDSILQGLLTGTSDLSSFDLNDLHLFADVYQVVIYERYNQDSFQPSWDFATLLRVANQENNAFEHITVDNRDVMLLKGSRSREHFENLLSHYDQNPQKGSPLDSLFLTYGPPVYRLDRISDSYQDALALLGRRFFCEPNQHILGYQALPDFMNRKSSEPLETSYYSETLANLLKSQSRGRLAECLQSLEQKLYYSSESISSIKFQLIDIYLQIKQTMSVTYGSSQIPFPTNSAVIDLVQSKCYLYEIIQFFSEQFEVFMNAIGSPSSENIIDEILHYIDHNYQENLKLEGIAPLFGYNSSYLGKIFTKNVGENFNSYLDRVRIEHSKSLLLSDKYKVYEVAERVGYKNVDYFHKKFKKYTGLSPAEFRKNNAL